MLKLVFIGLGLIMAGVHLNGMSRIGALALLMSLLLKTVFRLSINFVIFFVVSICIVSSVCRWVLL